MNKTEQNSQGNKAHTKITLGLVLGCGLGVLAAISGITLLFSQFLTGILMLLLAAILLPPVNKLVADKLNFSISGGLKFVIVIILLGVIGTTMSTDSIPNTNTNQGTKQANINDMNGQTRNQQEEVVTNRDTQKVEEPKRTKAIPVKQVPAPKTNRESTLAILKENASSKWGNDYQMVQYEYNNQVKAYNWVEAQTKYPNIMTKAKTRWSTDYQMVKYEYNNQVEAYEWIMAQTEYPDIMTSAKQKWDDDYQMVKYEYNNQVEAYKNL